MTTDRRNAATADSARLVAWGDGGAVSVVYQWDDGHSYSVAYKDENEARESLAGMGFA